MMRESRLSPLIFWSNMASFGFEERSPTGEQALNTHNVFSINFENTFDFNYLEKIRSRKERFEDRPLVGTI